MVSSNPRVKQLRDRVTALKQEKVALKDTWSERNDVLHEGQDLQVSCSTINQAYVIYGSLMRIPFMAFLIILGGTCTLKTELEEQKTMFDHIS